MFNSWDRYMIPKPFAQIAVFYGEAIRIPRNAKGDELETYRLILQERLNEGILQERLNEGARWCDEQFGSERPWRKVTEEGMPEIGALS
jgi:hypothetical protein